MPTIQKTRVGAGGLRAKESKKIRNNLNDFAINLRNLAFPLIRKKNLIIFIQKAHR